MFSISFDQVECHLWYCVSDPESVSLRHAICISPVQQNTVLLPQHDLSLDSASDHVQSSVYNPEMTDIECISLSLLFTLFVHDALQ